MYYYELTPEDAGKQGFLGRNKEPTGQSSGLGENRDPGFPQRRGVLSRDNADNIVKKPGSTQSVPSEIGSTSEEKIFRDRMNSAYANFYFGLREQGLLRLGDEEIRERIVVIRDLDVDPDIAKQARLEIVESTIGLIPPLINKYASPGTPKEEAVTEAYFALHNAIDNFNLDVISEITAEPPKFTSYAVSCMISLIQNPRTIEDISIPVHSPSGFRTSIHYVYQARKAFEEKQGREPSNDELYEEAALLKKSVTGTRMQRDVFDGVLTFFFIRPFDNLSQTLEERGWINRDTLEAFHKEISEVTRDPDAEVEGGVIFQEERQKLIDGIESALSALKPSQRRVIELRFGFTGREHTLNEIGEELGVTRQNVQQVEETAKRRLRSQEVIKQLKDYLEG